MQLCSFILSTSTVLKGARNLKPYCKGQRRVLTALHGFDRTLAFADKYLSEIVTCWRMLFCGCIIPGCFGTHFIFLSFIMGKIRFQMDYHYQYVDSAIGEKIDEEIRKLLNSSTLGEDSKDIRKDLAKDFTERVLDFYHQAIIDAYEVSTSHR
jgi:hypothetical protein